MERELDRVTAWYEGLNPSQDVLLNISLSAALILGASTLILLAKRWVAGLKIQDVDDKARIVSATRNGAILATTLILVVLWSPQLKTATLSIVAFAAALVIATKEVILCLIGGLVRAGAGMFSVGDRVEIGATRGEVIETGFFTVKMLELGPYPTGHGRSGSVLIIPNSQLLIQKVVNESTPGRYILHSFEIQIVRRSQLTPMVQALEKIVHEECGRDIEAARRHLERYRRRHQLLYPDAKPKLCMYFRELNQVLFYVRVPVLEVEKSLRQQAITRRFVEVVDRYDEMELFPKSRPIEKLESKDTDIS